MGVPSSAGGCGLLLVPPAGALELVFISLEWRLPALECRAQEVRVDMVYVRPSPRWDPRSSLMQGNHQKRAFRSACNDRNIGMVITNKLGGLWVGKDSLSRGKMLLMTVRPSACMSVKITSHTSAAQHNLPFYDNMCRSSNVVFQD